MIHITEKKFRFEKTGDAETDKLLEQLASVVEKNKKPIKVTDVETGGSVGSGFFGLAYSCC